MESGPIDVDLHAVVAKRVVQELILLTIAEIGPAGDGDHRDSLRERTRNRVQQTEAPNRIGDAHRADIVHTGVRVRRVSGAQLAAGSDELDVALDDLVHQPEHVVAGNAEDVPYPDLAETLDQIGSDSPASGHAWKVACIAHRRPMGRASERGDGVLRTLEGTVL